jgi:oxygen-independent coproporphyrinogen-3 oxidase
VLDDEARHAERVLLELRLVEGIPLGVLGDEALPDAALLLDDGLLEPAPYAAGNAVLTMRGRLLADAAVRALLP